MIKNIKHKGLRLYWTKGQTKGLNADWLSKLTRILSSIDAALEPEELNYPGAYFHALAGKDNGRFSLRLTANFRVTFGWEGEEATNIDIEDYH